MILYVGLMPVSYLLRAVRFICLVLTLVVHDKSILWYGVLLGHKTLLACSILMFK